MKNASKSFQVEPLVAVFLKVLFGKKRGFFHPKDKAATMWVLGAFLSVFGGNPPPRTPLPLWSMATRGHLALQVGQKWIFSLKNTFYGVLSGF